MLKKKEKEQLILFLWIVIPVLIETVLARQTTQRYIVSFLPLIVIPASLFLSASYNKFRILGTSLILVTLVIPLLITTLQILNPQVYIKEISRFTNHSQGEYIGGQTSGYGVYEAVFFIKKEAGSDKVFVGVADNTGNPESAVIVFLNKEPNVVSGYFDSRLLQGNQNGYDCISLKTRTYFVSRNDQQVGLDKFLVKVKDFRKPYGNDYVGVYKLKDNCKGETLFVYPVKSN